MTDLPLEGRDSDKLRELLARAREHFAPSAWTAGPPATWLNAPSKKGGPAHIADIRGWGYFTGRGHGALGLSDEEGISAQDAIGNLIVAAVNVLESHLSTIDTLTAQVGESAKVIARLQTEYGVAYEEARSSKARAERAEARNAELEARLNTPELHDFAAAVVLEAAHQRERWGAEHAAGKAPEDWFWLIGYLAGKCLHAAKVGDAAKALHHTISAAAALANWHAALSGANTEMRPGHGEDFAHRLLNPTEGA